MGSRHYIDRGLPERSKLQFFFPNPAEGEDYYVVALPFFENPRITERKKARYQTYQTISRSSNMYSYLGADSRQITVEFNMTLDHILDSGNIYLERYAPILRGEFNQDTERARFAKLQTQNTSESPASRLAYQYKTLSNVKSSAEQVLNSDFMQRGGNSFHAVRDNIVKVYGLEDADLSSEEAKSVLRVASVNRNEQLVTSLTSPPPTDFETTDKLKAIDVIIYWVNIIRSSVINNSQNPLYGPPIIRLTHGILYEDVPCVCKDYSLSYNDAAGFDIKTLLPRQIKITMKLEESRTGNFGVFDGMSENSRTRDNLAGWESVVTKPTRSGDPGSGGRTA
tara:strand:+ start:162 stop:1175 length:1014 start_codon:yes stop_codon:yes gene_type:complete